MACGSVGGWPGQVRNGTIDFHMFKLDICQYLLGPFLEMHAFRGEGKETLRKLLKDQEAYVCFYKPLPVAPTFARS